MTEREKMASGELYYSCDPQLERDRKRGKKLTRYYNQTTEEEEERREEILQELFSSVGKKVHIEPPFHCDYGYHIQVGDYLYANYGCVILDICPVTIGNHVMLGPGVNIYTAAHPIDPQVRNLDLEFGKPVTIGDNVWIGGNTVINPGVTIGENAIIGSGSVVTKDIPASVIAAGNPCRVLRKITQEDEQYWQKQKEAYYRQIER